MPPKGTAGLALSWVRGMSLSPLPPAMIKASVFFIIRDGAILLISIESMWKTYLDVKGKANN